METIAESTFKWAAYRTNAPDTERAKWMGPRIAQYVAIWESLDRRWRTMNEIAERSGVVTGDRNRQVRRVLMAMEEVGMVKYDRSTTPYLVRRSVTQLRRKGTRTWFDSSKPPKSTK